MTLSIVPSDLRTIIKSDICKNLYIKGTIFLFDIKCKLLPFIHKTIDVSHVSCVRV